MGCGASSSYYLARVLRTDQDMPTGDLGMQYVAVALGGLPLPNRRGSSPIAVGALAYLCHYAVSGPFLPAF